ncbi:MAG: biotin/lipoyl-binding protein [Clostridiales Family XIII bacterium]|jgi:multidrug resistance efflux pump|nr:biotin/lipoyl-binding protein [Clostridiales Family XIII bacterium]
MGKYCNIRTIGITVAVLLALCLFLSKTIYTFNMPQVTATIPFSGKLSKTETANGLADWAEKESVRTRLAGKVEEIYVRDGDLVSSGQPLFRLSFDDDDTLERISQLNISREKLELDMENINMKTDKANADMEALGAERERELKKAQDNYDRMRSLYQAGAAAQADFETAEYTLKTTADKYDKQFADLKNTLLTYGQDMKGKQLDLQNADAQLAPYRELLSADGVVKAESAGIVGEISISRGEYVTAAQETMTIGVSENFIVECTIPLENSFVAVGDECRLTNSAHSFKGSVEKLAAADKTKTVSISVAGDGIAPDESFSVTFSKEGEQSQKLVANGAVQQDGTGYFLYKIVRRKGTLGNEYTTEKLPIYIGDSDNENTVILNDIGFFEPVVLSSSKTFGEGDTILLKNSGDFFEKE